MPDRVDAERRWDAAELGPVITGLVARARPNADLWGDAPGATRPESAPGPGA